MKTCKKCRESKPKSDFQKHCHTADLLRPECRQCTQAYAKRYRKQNRSDRKALLRKLYSMTLQDYDKMLESQDGKCAICGTDDTGHHGVFCVDHDHYTGKVRGLLCQFCNCGLGQFRDNIKLMAKAIGYLTSKERE